MENTTGNNTVTVVTKARPNEVEEFFDVFSSPEAAETYLRENVSPNLKRDCNDFYVDNGRGDVTIYFIHNTEVKS